MQNSRYIFLQDLLARPPYFSVAIDAFDLNTHGPCKYIVTHYPDIPKIDPAVCSFALRGQEG